MDVRCKLDGRYPSTQQFYTAPHSSRRVSKPKAIPQAILTKLHRYDPWRTRVTRTVAKPSRPMGAVGLSFRSYRNSESTARDLISSIWTTLDRNLDTCTIFVNTIADLLDEEVKKEELLNTWDSFEVEVRPPRKSLVLTASD